MDFRSEKEQQLSKIIDRLLDQEVKWINDFRNPRVYQEDIDYRRQFNENYADTVRRIIKETVKNEN